MVFLQENALFSYDGASCVRNDYYHQGCQICVDICPQEAFSIIRHKLRLDTATCNSCAGCIGSCPSEALSLKGFDANAFVASKNAMTKLSCKDESVCLGIFSAQHLCAISLNQEETLHCDLSHCGECSINSTKTVYRAIKENIHQANTLLERSKKNPIHVIENAEIEPAKRRLFRKALEGFKEGVSDSAYQEINTQQHKAKLPHKYALLNASIKANIESFEVTHFDEKIALFTQKSIDFKRCTLCKDCVEFCPTEALFLTSDKQGIFFKESHCIGCGICDDICKSDAISTKSGFDLMNIATNRAEALVHYEMVRCNECKTPYPYKGGNPICQRCESFLDESEDMVTLARDL